MRSMLCEAEFTAEVIPVDQAIAGLIGIGYTLATMKSKYLRSLWCSVWCIQSLNIFRPENIPVYNLTCSEKKRLTWGTVLNEGKRLNYEFPFEGLSQNFYDDLKI